ncbi:MAG: hypothetical protein RL653_552 [Pseudomonadota bacterium]
MSKRIGEILVDAGSLTEVELRQALLQQKKQGGKPRIGELLLGLKKITPEVLATALAEQHKLTFVKLPAEIPQAISRRLTPEYQKKNNVLPFRKDMVSGVDQIHVAIPDPTQKELLEQIQGKFREVIRFCVATPADIAASIDRAATGPVSAAPAPAPVAASAPAAPVAPPPAAADPLDDLFGGPSSAAPAPPASGADLLDDLFGGPVAAAAPGAGPAAADPLDDLFGGPSSPAPAAAASAPAAGDPLDDLFGGPSSAAPAAAASAPAAGDPLDDLLGGSSPAPVAAASAPSAGDALDDLFGGAAPAAPATDAGDPLGDLLGDAPPAAATGRDPLDALTGDGPTDLHTPPAYVHMFPPKPRPAPVVAAPEAPPAEPLGSGDASHDRYALPIEKKLDAAPLDDSVPPEVLASGPDDPYADEDAWLIQELQRLAAGEPAQADAVATVASLVRMLVRKGVIQQEALLGELGR